MSPTDTETEQRVVIGTERSQFVTQKVLEYSIAKSSNRQVKTISAKQRYARVGGTNFGFVRFAVPSMMRYSGKAVYLDADQIVLRDIRQLFDELPSTHSVGLVKSPIGNFGGKTISDGNQTSVMVMSCADLSDWKVPELFSSVVPNRTELRAGQIHYRDFMSLNWYNQDKIFPIDPAWNHFNIFRADSKIVHFSHVRSQPWINPKHELAGWWNDWLIDTVRNGYLSKTRLWYEIQRGNVNKRFRLRNL